MRHRGSLVFADSQHRQTIYRKGVRLFGFCGVSTGNWTTLTVSRSCSSGNKPDGEWNRIAGEMMLKFAESGFPVFRGTTPLSRGSVTSKRGGKTSIHFNAEPQAAELWLRTVIFGNQLFIYGAVADWCNNQTPPAAEPQVEQLHQEFHQNLYQVLPIIRLWTP